MKTKQIAFLSALPVTLTLAVHLASTPAKADEVCSAVASCRELQLKTQAQLAAEIRDAAPALTDVLSDANGKARYISQKEAIQYCKDQGTRLPTIREYALYAQELGAPGIRETAYPNLSVDAPEVKAEIARMEKNNPYESYFPVYGSSPSGDIVVDFYYSRFTGLSDTSDGYRRPEGLAGNVIFWSSSGFFYGPHDGYVFSGSYGVIKKNTKPSSHHPIAYPGEVGSLAMAVRCIKAPAFSPAPAPSTSKVCYSVTGCRTLLRQIEDRLSTLLQNQIPNLADVVTLPNGDVDTMSFYQAVRYCRSQASRLPTIRELALYTQTLGAKGLNETAFPGSPSDSAPVQAEIAQMKATGYSPVYVFNKDYQSSVGFYFSSNGYQRPSDVQGKFMFWSSDRIPGAYNYTWALIGQAGDITDWYTEYSSNYRMAVRCLKW